MNMQERYDKALDEWPQAGETIRKPYNDMRTALEEYINAVQEAAFCYGYQCAQMDRKAVDQYE